MPPRYAYWTILAGGLPTAFRASEREELEPTFRQILKRHPDAQMKWFSRGRLWDSPDAAAHARRAATERRASSWRPGGDHRDPRQKFREAKKARNQERRRRRWSMTQEDAAIRRPPSDERPHPQGAPHPTSAGKLGRSSAGPTRHGQTDGRPSHQRTWKRQRDARPPRGRFGRPPGTGDGPADPSRPDRGPDRENLRQEANRRSRPAKPGNAPAGLRPRARSDKKRRP